MWNELVVWQKAVMIVLGVVGVVAVIVAIIYFVEPARSLPSFFPAHGRSRHLHATHHAEAALGLGVVLLVIAALIPVFARRSRTG